MAREHSILCFNTLPKQNLVQMLLAYNFCLSKSWKAIISMLDLASSYYLSGNYRKMKKPPKKYPPASEFTIHLIKTLSPLPELADLPHEPLFRTRNISIKSIKSLLEDVLTIVFSSLSNSKI